MKLVLFWCVFPFLLVILAALMTLFYVSEKMLLGVTSIANALSDWAYNTSTKK